MGKRVGRQTRGTRWEGGMGRAAVPARVGARGRSVRVEASTVASKGAAPHARRRRHHHLHPSLPLSRALFPCPFVRSAHAARSRFRIFVADGRTGASKRPRSRRVKARGVPPAATISVPVPRCSHHVPPLPSFTFIRAFFCAFRFFSYFLAEPHCAETPN